LHPPPAPSHSVSLHDALPISIVVLVTLFAFQRHGTARIGRVFRPTMLVWFAVIGILGIKGIIQAPEVLRALNPIYAVRFFQAYPDRKSTRLNSSHEWISYAVF